MSNTTTRKAAKAMAKAICELRAVDAALAERIARKVAEELASWREATAADAREVEDEARMLAAG